MDIQKILDLYRQNNHGTPISQLSDGRIVVGEEVDENNHLFYVIKDDQENYTLEDAQGLKVIEALRTSDPIIRTHKMG